MQAINNVADDYFRDETFSHLGEMEVGHINKGVKVGTLSLRAGTLNVDFNGNWKPLLPAATLSTLSELDPKLLTVDSITDVMTALHVVDEKSPNSSHFANIINTLYKGAIENPSDRSDTWASHCVNCSLSASEQKDNELTTSATIIARHFILLA